jgi:hypothetical protein
MERKLNVIKDKTSSARARSRGEPMSDDMIRLRGVHGQDEVNARCISYKVNRWGVVTVPAEDAAPLLKVGGFARAVENDPTAPNSTLSDVLDVVWHLAPGKIRSTLLMLCENTNALNYVIQSARPNIRIV